MATIRTAIELQDNFTGILYQVINSVNLGLATMEDLQQTMNTPVDMASLEGARNEINQATIAVQKLDAAMQNMSEPQLSAPTTLPLSQPQQVPVQWQTDTMDVFTNSGVERFQQEVQSTNQMLEQLSTTQDSIARQAYNTSVLPPEAFQNLNQLAVRIDMVRDKIQQIESNSINLGTDEANAGLEQLRGQLNQAIQEQQNLNRALDNMDAQAANEAYLRLSQTVGSTERYIRDNTTAQGQFNSTVEQGTNEAGTLMNMIKGMVAAYVSVQTVSKILDSSDQLTSTTARLNLMNDGLQTTDELTKMVFASAQNARGSFQEMADVVARFGNNAGDAFGSSEEVVVFAELIQKQMTIAGASTTEASNAMLQLAQGLGSGVLRGDELNSIFEQAPNLIQNIADYLGVPIGEIREMASEGELTADIVKNAIFAATDEINANFEAMPMTWGQIWQSFQNTALVAFTPVLQRINDLANSDGFQNFVTNAVNALAWVAGVALDIFDIIASVGGFIADNWSWLSPIIYGVAAALAVYYGWQLAVNAIQAISKGIHIAMAIAQMIHAAATGALTAATAAEIAAQNGLNAALYACPIVWIIVLIIALIALFYAAVAAVNKFAETSVSATGIICGAFMVALAFIGNIFVALWNLVVDVFVLIYNLVAEVANFIGNVFTDPIGAVCRLFFGLADTVLGILQALASAIDAIFGSDLSGAVQGWCDSLGGWVDDTFGQGEEIMAKMNADDMKLGRFEYGAAWDAGYDFGEGIDESISNFDPSSLFDTNIPGADEYGSLGGLGGIGSGVDDIAGNTEAIKDSMDITEEDLKYLRDIAEQEAINRFTTAEISVDMSGMRNTVNNGMDLDGVISGLTDAVNEAIDSMAEGVHD